MREERGVSRPQTLAELFSTLTGNPKNRADSEIAVEIVQPLADSFDFVNLMLAEMRAALKSARTSGVRGGRVHDLFHAWRPKSEARKKFSRWTKTIL